MQAASVISNEKEQKNVVQQESISQQATDVQLKIAGQQEEVLLPDQKEQKEWEKVQEENRREREESEAREKKEQKLLKQLEKQQKKSSNRKKASAAEVLTSTMSELLQEDGTYREAGNGSEISIEDAQDLRCLSEYTNSGYNTAGVNFNQTADIDCNGATMAAIGTLSVNTEEVDEWGDPLVEYHTFQGCYDGGEHAISNVIVSCDAGDTGYYGNHVGLFGYLSDAVVKNVIVDSMDIDHKMSGEGDDEEENSVYIGVIAGICFNSVLDHCENHADISLSMSFDRMAGICSYVDEDSVIRNCINSGNLTATSGDGLWNYGIVGIAGSCYGEINDCINKGNITNYRFSCGIVLSAYWESNISNCRNLGNVEGTVGAYGINWYAYETLMDCCNEGSIRGNNTAAGIAYNIDERMVNCNNSGKVSSDYYAGGIVAEMYKMDSYSFTNCRNTGEVYGERYAGGIVGIASSDGCLSDCVNEGKISSDYCAGGIVGKISSYAISSCVNKGTVESKQNAGGIVGFSLSRADICNVQNYGKVTAEQNAGGIVGRSFQTDVVNAWNHGKVDGKSSAGGVIGTADLMTYFEECYAEDLESDPEYYEEVKAQFQSEKMKQQMKNTIANGIHVGSVYSEQIAGAMIGQSELPDQVDYCYYQKDSTEKVCGSDAAVIAKVINSGEWKQETFLDELNQNLSVINHHMALTMKYDKEQIIQWMPAVYLRISFPFYENDMEGVVAAGIEEQLNLNYVLLQKSTNTYLPMVKKGDGYQTQGIELGEYELFRVMPDGSYRSQYQFVCIEEGESIAGWNVYVSVFQMITDISYQKNESGGCDITGMTPYYAVAYMDCSDIILPEPPTKEGYTFGGWYSIPYVYNEELYAYYKEEQNKEFLEKKEWYESWYDKAAWEWYDGTKEEYVSANLKEDFGYDTWEDYSVHFDEVVEKNCRFDNPIIEDEEEGSYLAANTLFAKWIADTEQKQPEPTATGQQTTVVYQQPDAASYQETGGNYVKKAGVIYQIDTKKKTAKVTGVSNRQVKKVVIQSTVTGNGVTCKVTAIAKNAFADCRKLKKITVKGKNLQSVHKTALKGTKKVTILADKKVKKLFQKALKK